MDDEPGRGAPEPGEGGERFTRDTRPSDVAADAVDPDVAVHVDAVVAAHGDRVFDLCLFALGSPAEAAEATLAVLAAVVLDEGPLAADLIDATAVDVALDRAPRHGNPPAPSWPSSGRAVVDEARASIASQIAPWTALERLVFALRVRHGRSAAAVALATGVREGRVDALCNDLAAGLSGESGVALADTALLRDVLPLVGAPAGLAAEIRRRIAGRQPALGPGTEAAPAGAGSLRAEPAAAPRVAASTVGTSVTTVARSPSAGGRFSGWRQRRAAAAASFAAVAAGLALVGWGVTSFGAGSEPESVAAVAPSTTVGRGTTSDSPATDSASTERTDRVRRSTTSTAGLLFPPLPETTSGDLDGRADGDDPIDGPTLTGTTTPVVVTFLPPPLTTAPPGTVLTIPTTTPGSPTTTAPSNTSTSAPTTTTTVPPTATTAPPTTPPPTTSPPTSTVRTTAP